MRYLILLLFALGCTQKTLQGERGLASVVAEDALKFVVYKDLVYVVHSCSDFKKKRFDYFWSTESSPNYLSSRLKSLIQIASDQCGVNADFEVVLDHTQQIKSTWIEQKGVKQQASPLGSQVFLVKESHLKEVKFTPKVYQNIFLSTKSNPTY